MNFQDLLDPSNGIDDWLAAYRNRQPSPTLKETEDLLSSMVDWLGQKYSEESKKANATTKQATWTAIAVQCKHAQSIVRQFIDKTAFPRMTAVLLPAPILAALVFIITDLVGVGRQLAVYAAMACFLGWITLTVALLYFHSDEQIHESLTPLRHRRLQLEDDTRDSAVLLWKIQGMINFANEELLDTRIKIQRSLQQERRNANRHALAQRDWRSMRGVEFEHFLEEVFREKGYHVETTPSSGDQGVDLIIAKVGRRIAVQVKGYAGSVGNSAVQEAFAGMAHYKCDACCVITNSEFTESAKNLAMSTGCILIHGGQIVGLITNDVSL